ncbi:hypothetical protein PIROE2DRAFT_7280 [Piromyces sp. E2]|nr:hypothetical protein PIROE2DRAFT_7280 [Piromyces sp. E2]|eukprot:OUM65693.1 hypothetical protein PIROE2DRAFT_7280 [Piromyces sp. E2]
MIIRANALIKFIHDNSETYNKRGMSSIYYEIFDNNGISDTLSYIQDINNYDIVISSNMKYKYNITADTAYNLVFESNSKCIPLYEKNKKIAITTIDDMTAHNCTQETYDYIVDVLNIKNLYEQDNLPELLIVQFNDIYDLRNYLQSKDNEIFSNLCNCKYYNNKLRITVMVKHDVINDATHSIPLEISDNIRKTFGYRKSLPIKLSYILKIIINISILIFMGKNIFRKGFFKKNITLFCAVIGKYN